LNSKLFGAGASGYAKGFANNSIMRLGWGSEGNSWSFRGALGHNPKYAAKMGISPVFLGMNIPYIKTPSIMTIPKLGFK
jgi:hypothetical protein